MLFLSLLAIMAAGNALSHLERDWTKDMFPSMYSVEDVVRLPESSGCKFILYTVTGLTAYGSECKEIPLYPDGVQETSLSVLGVGMEVLPIGSFTTWGQLVSLRIDNNNELRFIEPGVFFHLSSLKNLSISHNYNLGVLHEEVFDGLVNLEEFRFIKNNLSTLYEVTLATRPFLLPSLRLLDVSENHVGGIRRSDFIHMEESLLETLSLRKCEISSIEPKALTGLNNLKTLNLDKNYLMSDDGLLNFIYSLDSTNSRLRHLGLAKNFLTDWNMYELLRAISATNITSLDLSDNNFGDISSEFFPPMPNVKWLYMNGVNSKNMADGAFNEDLFPNLRHLFFARNGLSGLVQGLRLEKIVELDVSDNKCDYCFINSMFTIGGTMKMFSIEVLVASDNYVFVLINNMFNGMDSLRALFLSNCSIYEIQDWAFYNLHQLEHLDLSYNKFSKSSNLRAYIFEGLRSLTSLRLDSCSIESLPDADIFIHLPNLKYLTLRDNNLHEFQPTIFQPISALIRLDVSYNDILPWSARLFSGNSELESLSVASNHIYKFTSEMMDDFKDIRLIDMRDNPIQCKCDLVRVTMGQEGSRSENYFGLNDSSVKCFSPQKWSDVQVMEFIELNSINYNCPTKQLYALVIGLCVLFSLVISFVGVYYLRWYLRYWMFLFKQTWRSSFPVGKREPLDGKYKYDAFVSYCNEDRNFVVRLVAMMENYEPYYRLCVFERDFNAGDVICETVLDCLSISRKTIFILTDSFARSQWCQWELQMAQHKRIFFSPEGRDSLILIKLGNIMEANMTPTLRYLTKTRVYLQWYSDPKRQRVFWEKLREALAPSVQNEVIV